MYTLRFTLCKTYKMSFRTKLAFMFIICDVALAADTVFLRNTIQDHFSEIRHHGGDPCNKKAVLQFIQNEFTAYGLETETQSFGVPVTFTNVIGVRKGRNYGTSKDRVVGLGTHYDTVQVSPGVDDNGSGMAAMLHAVRHFHTSGGSWDHTMVFVAFDAEELGLQGSSVFVKDWWKPFLDTSGIVNTTGFIILDTIMDYNTTIQSQEIVKDFERFFPKADASIKSDGGQGDFITVMYRGGSDDVLANSFNTSWRAGSRTEHELEELRIPTTDLTAINTMLGDLTRSDHWSFWLGGTPAIFVSDTANLRGKMQACYHHQCDNVTTMLTDANIQFLGKTADTVIASLDRLAGRGYTSSAPSLCLGFSALFPALLAGLHVTRIVN